MVNPKIKRGTVVLINFPFSDGHSSKVRPAVIVTPDFLMPMTNDVLCIFISSSLSIKLLPSDYVIEMTNSSFKETGLQLRSTLRGHKIALIEKTYVNRVIGKLDNILIDEMNKHIKIALGL